MGLDVLKKWKPVFSQSTFLLTDILHQLGWWLVLGLKYLCDASQTLVDEMYKLLDFTQYGNLTKIFSANEVRILLGILFAFAWSYADLAKGQGKTEGNTKRAHCGFDYNCTTQLNDNAE